MHPPKVKRHRTTALFHWVLPCVLYLFADGISSDLGPCRPDKIEANQRFEDVEVPLRLMRLDGHDFARTVAPVGVGGEISNVSDRIESRTFLPNFGLGQSTSLRTHSSPMLNPHHGEMNNHSRITEC